MKFESEICKICPIKEVCDKNLFPERANGRLLVTTNPWYCRHLTCPSGVDSAKKEINKLKNGGVYRGYAYFKSADKPAVRRVLVRTGIIESNQNGSWYSTGQSIYKNYQVDPQYFPYRKIRNNLRGAE
jgi:hypothetical protein